MWRVSERVRGWERVRAGHDNGDIRLWDLDTGPWAVLQQHTNSVTSLVMAMIRKNEELLISGACLHARCGARTTHLSRTCACC